MLTSLDGDALAAYCTAWAGFQWATETINQHGSFVIVRRGKLVPHPAIALQQTSLRQMRSLGELLGLSLAWRSRLSVEAPSEEMDEFERFLAEGAAMAKR